MVDRSFSSIDDDESMIKYFREKFIGRPVNIGASDESISFDPFVVSNDDLENPFLMKPDGTHETAKQVDKVISNQTRSSVSPSAPIIIPKKTLRSAASSQSSSASVTDQMSTFDEFSKSARRESDDNINSTLPTLLTAGDQLQHRAALDRISVKSKLRQPLKQKLSAVKETNDQHIDLFSKELNDANLLPKLDAKQSSIDSTDEKQATIPHRMLRQTKSEMPTTRRTNSHQPRDGSEEDLLQIDKKDSVSTITNYLEKSLNLKQPIHISTPKNNHQLPLIIKSDVESNRCDSNFDHENTADTHEIRTPSMSSSSSQEHIYDNLDVCRHSKKSSSPEITRESKPPVPQVAMRDKIKANNVRLRPVTVHVSTNEPNSAPNEFEQIFNRLKRDGSIRKKHQTSESISPNDTTVKDSPSHVSTPFAKLLKPVASATIETSTSLVDTSEEVTKSTELCKEDATKPTQISIKETTKSAEVCKNEVTQSTELCKEDAPKPTQISIQEATRSTQICEEEATKPVEVSKEDATKPAEVCKKQATRSTEICKEEATKPAEVSKENAKEHVEHSVNGEIKHDAVPVGSVLSKPKDPPPINRRKTLPGMPFSSTNKVGIDELKPSPSWIEIAKQKQNKNQATTDETGSKEETPAVSSSQGAKILIPSTEPQNDAQSLEDSSNNTSTQRDSIRALKSGDPNRISKLIRLFEK